MVMIKCLLNKNAISLKCAAWSMSEQENTFCLFILIFISAAMISLMMAYHLMITHLENFLAYKRENEDQTSKGLNKNCRKFQVKDTFGTEMNCPSF